MRLAIHINGSHAQNFRDSLFFRLVISFASLLTVGASRQPAERQPAQEESLDIVWNIAQPLRKYPIPQQAIRRNRCICGNASWRIWLSLLRCIGASTPWFINKLS